MCDHEVEYTEFPTRIIGGPTGNYSIQSDVVSCQWAEYLITGISNGASSAATVVANGNAPMTSANDLKYDGTITLNDDNLPKGNSFSALASTTIPAPMINWERITNSQKRVFIRINAGNSNSCFVNIRFRIAKLKIIPGPNTTTHPDTPHLINEARADAVRQRLGLEKEIDTVEETITASPARAKNMKEMLRGQR